MIHHMARDYASACETHIWSHVPAALQRYLGLAVSPGVTCCTECFAIASPMQADIVSTMHG